MCQVLYGSQETFENENAKHSILSPFPAFMWKRFHVVYFLNRHLFVLLIRKKTAEQYNELKTYVGTNYVD